MRIADKMNYDQVNSSIAKNRSEMTNLQNQASTQKRVTKPSDDPVAASRVLSSKTEQRGVDQFIKNMNYAKSFLDFSESALGELSEVMMRAKELAISQSDDAAASSTSRRIVATEVGQLFDQAVQIGNRKLGERYIFGGYKTNEPPFDIDGLYHGDRGEMKIHIDKDSFLSMNMPGNVVFQGVGLSRDGTGFRTEKQARTVNEFRDQKKAIADQSKRLSDAPPIEDNVEKIESERGPASLRPLQLGKDAKSELMGGHEVEAGSVSNEDNSGISVLDTLKKFKTALMANDKEGVQESLDRLDDALQQVVMSRTQLGSRVMAIDNTMNSLQTANVDLKTDISGLEDADTFEVISNINKTQDTLQATLATSGKLIQKSLMDFIS